MIPTASRGGMRQVEGGREREYGERKVDVAKGREGLVVVKGGKAGR